MVAQAQFSATEITARPGESEILGLTLYNLGAQTETYTIVPSGLSAGWVLISPPSVTLFSGSNEIVRVTVRPPKMSSTPAGPHPVTVRIIPQNHPDEVLVAETTVNVEAFHDRRLQLLQPVRRSRRRASFEFLVENHGNSHASCRLQLIDLTKRLDGRFDPPAVGVEPGANALVRLRVKALGRQWRRGSRTLPFAIEASQQGFPSAEAGATLVQTPIMPEALGRKVLGVGAIAGVGALGWIFLLKPAAERAAKDAVRTTAISTTSTVPTVAGPTTLPLDVSSTPTSIVNTPATVGTTPAAVGDRFSKVFNVAAAPGGAAVADVYTVAPGQTLVITDIVLQNPNFDAGSAALMRNADVLFPWKLDDSTGNDSVPLRTGLTFVAGDAVTFQVICTAVGDPAAGTCTTRLLLIGQLIPAG